MSEKTEDLGRRAEEAAYGGDTTRQVDIARGRWNAEAAYRGLYGTEAGAFVLGARVALERAAMEQCLYCANAIPMASMSHHEPREDGMAAPCYALTIRALMPGGVYDQG